MIVDTNICPLCGKPNHCPTAMNNNQPVMDCWCREFTFPQALLDLVPTELKNRSCICRHCVESFIENRQEK